MSGIKEWCIVRKDTDNDNWTGLVDRKETDKKWWTRDFTELMRFGNLVDATVQLSKLEYGKLKVVSFSKAKRLLTNTEE